MERSNRSGRTIVALVALVVVAAVTLAPRGIVAPARGIFSEILDAAMPPIAAGLPYADERALNIVLFVPLGATLALLFARRLWPLALLAGVAVSIAVELAQSSIPGRVPDPHDVLWNSLGAAVGAVVVGVLRGLAALARRSMAWGVQRRGAASSPSRGVATRGR